MGSPPLAVGGVNVTVACLSPAVAVPMAGALGTTPVIANDWLTCGAAEYVPLPAWLVLMVQVPGDTVVSAPLLVIVHTPVVLDENVTGRPELAVALNVGDVPK